MAGQNDVCRAWGYGWIRKPDGCSNPCGMRRLYIPLTITHQHALRQVKPMIGGRLQDHPRRRFTPVGEFPVNDVSLRMIGTVIDGQEGCVLGDEALTHPACKVLKVLFRIESASNSGLVGHYDQHIAKSDRLPAELENSFHKMDISDSMDIAMVGVDHPVTIKE